MGSKFGFIGLRPKCKMQNEKCKIKKRETEQKTMHRNDFLIWDNSFSGVCSLNITIKLAFAPAKGFIRT